MTLFSTISLAFRALWRNRVRSVLTMLGIVFGIGAVIAMVSSGKGAQQAVREVFQNLGTNVLIVTNGSQPMFGAAGGAGSKQALTWTDRGIGIDAADLSHVFTPFFRADRSRSRATGGFGLGLAFARRVVEAHGGAIRIESEHGAGTTVTFTIPAS
jgi:signal transduction histidine kinase